MSESIKIRSLLEDTLVRSCDELVRETTRVPIDHWNESVFQFLFVRNLLDERPNLDCRTEWKRVDLILFLSQGASAQAPDLAPRSDSAYLR